LLPGWIVDGQVVDYSALSDALALWLAQTGVRKLAMTLPAEVCCSRLLQQPPHLRPWRRRPWLAQQAALARSQESAVWLAHRLEQSPAHWRIVSAPLDLIQDWQGLAEAAGCQLQLLEDAHQASWRALQRWSDSPSAGACLFQVGASCVQVLQEQAGCWQWRWRSGPAEPELLSSCLSMAEGSPEIFLIGEGELADTLRQGLSQAGRAPREPALLPGLCSEDTVTAASWPALGLAGSWL